jgi:hypothetical protein
MKTFSELRVDELLSFSARKAKGRAMRLMNKKSSTKKKKERNALRPLDMQKAEKKAQKSARKTIMQKVLGKGKDMADLSMAQKANLEKKTEKRVKKMGAAYKNLVKRMTKVVRKKHNEKMKDLKQKKSEK